MNVFLPKSFTIVASDCRGTNLLFRGVFVALGSRIIPEDTDMSNQSLLQCGLDEYEFKHLNAWINIFFKRVCDTN